MLPNTLSKISQSTLVKNLSERKKDKLLKVLSTLKKGYILYPGIIIRHTGVTMNQAYDMLDEIESLKIIQKAYEVTCPSCQRYTGEIYDSLNDVPNEYFCESCDHEFKFPEGILVVYRVINE